MSSRACLDWRRASPHDTRKDRCSPGHLRPHAIVFLASPLHTPTDSTFSALVSENLLRHGSFALNRWFPDGGAKLPYQVERIGAHVYPWYPPGGPVSPAPLVGILALLGLSAIGHDGGYDAAGDLIVQAILAALLMAVLAVVFLRIAQAILPAPGSWIVALGGAFGTQVWSTASRSLWGDTFLRLPIVGAVIPGARAARDGKAPVVPIVARDAARLGLLRSPDGQRRRRCGHLVCRALPPPGSLPVRCGGSGLDGRVRGLVLAHVWQAFAVVLSHPRLLVCDLGHGTGGGSSGAPLAGS